MASTDEFLDKIHKVSLYILLQFDKICREHDLTYFLDSGTALGAVRHSGFIPWDDDVDVGMPRKDYERFIRLSQDQIPEDLFIQTHDSDRSYKRNAAKLRLKGTVFQEFDNLPFEQNGFFIDIFPFDNVPRNKRAATLHVAISRLFTRIIGSWYSSEKSASRILRIIQILIKRIPEPGIERFNKMFVRFCRWYENQDTGQVTSHFWGMSLKKTYIFDTKKILPTKEITFEGYPVKIVQDPDYYLKLMYGNYMQLPPESEQRGHHIKGRIDFGKYA